MLFVDCSTVLRGLGRDKKVEMQKGNGKKLNCVDSFMTKEMKRVKTMAVQEKGGSMDLL